MSGSTGERQEWVREAVTMALYISLSLLAVLVATPSSLTNDTQEFGWTILLTSVALLLAHQVAFRLSSRLINKGLLDAESVRLIGAQTVGGLAAALVATAPVWLFGTAGVRVSELLLIVFVAATGYQAVRNAPTTRSRALLYTAGLVVVMLGIVALKVVVGH